MSSEAWIDRWLGWLAMNIIGSPGPGVTKSVLISEVSTYKEKYLSLESLRFHSAFNDIDPAPRQRKCLAQKPPTSIV